GGRVGTRRGLGSGGGRCAGGRVAAAAGGRGRGWVMATLWQRIRGRSSRAAVDPLAPYAVNPYLVGPAGPTMGREETYTGEFVAAVQHAYRSNGIIFACNLARASVFAEARFQFRRLQDGRPGDLFGTRELGVVESPWPGGTTADLLTRMIQDVD